MNIEQQRAAFEAWYQQHHGDRAMYGRDTSGEYTDKLVQAACNAWQAALQSQDREDVATLKAGLEEAVQTMRAVLAQERLKAVAKRCLSRAIVVCDRAIDHARRVEGDWE